MIVLRDFLGRCKDSIAALYNARKNLNLLVTTKSPKIGVLQHLLKIGTLQRALEQEYHQHSCWYFIFFIYGIASFFAANFQPEPLYPLIFAISLPLLAFIMRLRFFLASFVLLLIASFCAGLLIAEYRMQSITTTTLDRQVNGNITATIEEIEPARGGFHVRVNDITIDDNNYRNLVARIKISNTNLATSIDDIRAGDKIQGAVNLFPLQGSILPGSFEFGFFQYVRGIGASGFASGEVNIFRQNSQSDSSILNTIKESVYMLRNQMHQNIIDTLGHEKGNFVSAVLIGITSGIDKETADAMRGSGIAHILSVSGLHLSLIAMIFFFSARLLLNLSNYAAYNWNIKLISSCIAIIASFGYLILTGSKIAATRAFIMTSIFITAHMIGKTPYPIRSLFIAAFFILTIYPEYVMHPSFQLSFAAVLCLISGYEVYLKNQHLFGNNSSMIANIKFYFLANIYSTILAGLATSPFVIYHFFNVAGYGIIMNLLAVPLMSFIIMPLGSIVLLFYGSGIEEYILPVIGFFVGIIIDAAQAVINLPGAVFYFGYISKASLAVFSLGFFWLCVWHTSIRHLGWLIIIASIFMMFSTPKPNFIYDTKYHMLVEQKAGEKLVFHTKGKVPDFTKDFILNWYGRPKYEVINRNTITNYTSKNWLMNNKYELDNSQTIYTINTKSMIKFAQKKIGPRDIAIYQAENIEPISGDHTNILFSQYQSARTILGYCDSKTCRFEYSANGI